MSSLNALIAGPYNVALSLAVCIALALAVRAGLRAGVSLGPWSALLLGAASAGLIGSTFVSLNGTPLAPGAKSNVGGLAIGIPIAMLLAIWLRIGAWRALDLLSVPTLIGLAIGRLGCLLAGCCIGTASTLPWAIHYDGDETDRHPVQFYESIGDLLLAYGLTRAFRTSNTPLRAGDRATLAIGGYAALRFMTELLRAGRTTTYGLNPVQWWMLAVIAVLGVQWLARHANRQRLSNVRAYVMQRLPAMPKSNATDSLGRHHVALLGIGVALYLWPLMAPARFTPLESTVLQLLAVSGVAIALYTLKRASVATHLVAPSMGAMLLLQVGTEPDTPKRELLIGGSYFGQSYERVVGRRDEVGYDYCAGTDVTNIYDTRATRRAQSGWFSLGFRGRRASGLRIEAEGRALIGRDKLVSITEGPTYAPVSNSTRLQAGGLSVALDHPNYALRTNVLSGVFHSAGDRIATTTGSIQGRVIAGNGIFAEARVANPRLYLSTGEFSYIGAGWQFGAMGPRISAGVGQGGLLAVHVPFRLLEVDAALHAVGENTLPVGTTPGVSLQVGGRLAVPLR